MVLARRDDRSDHPGMTVVGTLIAESLRVGAVLDDVPMHVNKIARAELGDVSRGQPRTWTIVDFAIPDGEAESLVRCLEEALQVTGGWYCDLRSDDETFVIFAGRTFRYPRGDEAGRAAAIAHGQTVGVPVEQLDWPR